jgi:hypothetical protein
MVRTACVALRGVCSIVSGTFNGPGCLLSSGCQSGLVVCDSHQHRGSDTVRSESFKCTALFQLCLLCGAVATALAAKSVLMAAAARRAEVVLCRKG